MPRLRFFEDGEPIPVGSRTFVNHLSLDELGCGEVRSFLMRVAQEKLGPRHRVLDVAIQVKYILTKEDGGF